MNFQTEITDIWSFDTVVVGGGVAGFCAAVASARNGAKTALIEDMGALGGILTQGGNPEIGIFYADYRPAIAGIGWEFCKRLEAAGFAEIPDFSTVDTAIGGHASNVKVAPAMAEVLLNRMCLEAGVTLMLHSKVVAAEREGETVTHLIVARKCELSAVSAKAFIDCSGDGDVARVAHAGFHVSEELQPGTFGYSFFCNNLSQLQEDSLRKAFDEAKAAGKIHHGDYWPEFHAPIKGFFRGGGNNANHILMDCSNPQGQTDAEINGREAMARMIEFARANADITLYPSYAYTAPRETNRIVCDYTVTPQDFLSGKIFPGSLCYGYYNMDLHRSTNTDGGRPFEECADHTNLPRGVVPTVPLSSQTVKGLKNLLCAGRCLSAERPVMGAFRVKATCMATGEVAGTVAALCSDGNVRTVDLSAVRKRLTQNGAIVPDASLFAPAE